MQTQALAERGYLAPEAMQFGGLSLRRGSYCENAVCMNLTGFVSASRYDLGCFHAGIIEGGPNEPWEGVQLVSAVVNITITRTKTTIPRPS